MQATPFLRQGRATENGLPCESATRSWLSPAFDRSVRDFDQCCRNVPFSLTLSRTDLLHNLRELFRRFKSSQAIFETPQTAYTRALISAAFELTTGEAGAVST